ncbi:GTPase HflX [Paenibacillus ginsengarvi]|uniref:GTPase HflX n=1 Tax=Paenibacillus ginsengarvi TaxID=400777 RepID=A0A3B0CHL2_9BACL|nr:GTPase HflX [Paenibacillus ginsengarvi]RKN84114.1 GTPase HflX [Paenibacillus ginsengarvi]
MKQSTHEVSGAASDQAVVVSLVLKSERLSEEMVAYSLQELISLAESAGVEVLHSAVQTKESIDSKWFIGKGKVEEIREIALRLGANTAIFDQELSGAQVRNLERALDLKIIDRTQLILDIFAQRAKTREGFLQVELAQLSYLLPRLSGHGVNLSRLGGGIGTRGPGETKLEMDRRHIRNRIHELRQALQEVKRHRALHRERRKKTGVYQVALVGYTNAGKSTLLNRMTDANVYAENQLFATLDPTTRMLRLPNGQEVVLTDTVGFIQNLPHDLVAAFRATLEEVCEADLILHVVDSSSEMKDQQRKVVGNILQELGAQGKPSITVFNKIDLLPAGHSELWTAEGDSLRVSAFAEPDLERLKTAVQEKLMGGKRRFVIPAGRGDLISLLYRVGDVLEQEVDGEEIRFDVRLKQSEFDKMGHIFKAYMASEAVQQEGESY